MGSGSVDPTTPPSLKRQCRSDYTTQFKEMGLYVYSQCRSDYTTQFKEMGLYVQVLGLVGATQQNHPESCDKNVKQQTNLEP